MDNHQIDSTVKTIAGVTVILATLAKGIRYLVGAEIMSKLKQVEQKFDNVDGKFVELTRLVNELTKLIKDGKQSG